METTINTAYYAAYTFASYLTVWARATIGDERCDLDWDLLAQMATDTKSAFANMVPSERISKVLDLAEKITSGNNNQIEVAFDIAIDERNLEEQIIEELAAHLCL